MPSICRGWCLKRVSWMGILFALWGTLLFAVDIGRDLDPVVVKGQTLPALLGKDTIGLRVYAYKSGIWSPVPFQLDEVVAVRDSGYYSDFIRKLDPIDELVFMAKDLGDQAGEREWPPDEAAQQNARYEIAVQNPVSGATGYLYVYWSTDMATSGVSYISYADETVSTAKYVAGQNKAAAGGLLTDLTIPVSAGGDGIDLLDEQRLRISSTIKFTAIQDVNLVIKEQTNNVVYTIRTPSLIPGKEGPKVGEIVVDVRHSKYKHTAGPVRVIRTNYLAVNLSGYIRVATIIDKTITPKTYILPIGYKFYPDYYEMPFDSVVINLGDSFNDIDGLSFNNTKILLCNTLNANGKGMRFYTPRLENEDARLAGFKIDQKTDDAVYGKVAVLGAEEWPGKHWCGITSDGADPASPALNASLLTLVDLRGEKAPLNVHHIRYADNNFDDGAYVFGLNGVQATAISGLPPTIPLILTLRQYPFAQVYGYNELQSIFDTYKIPLTFSATKQMFDITSPGAIGDLMIAGRTDSTLTLSWTAVGDDGTAGRAATRYEIRYSESDPAGFSDLWAWWDNARLVEPAPAPGAPSTQELFTITGLLPDHQYYFALNVYDEANNFPVPFPMATIKTTPVELSAFTAAVRDHLVELNWRTASESSNYGFAVERRFEKESAWREIAFVKGHGTTSSARSYSWSDGGAKPGVIEYRLKQIDNDGSFSYSEPVLVTLSAPAVWALAQNYPNPFNPATTIDYEVPANSTGMVELTIFDLLGRRIRSLVRAQAQTGYHRQEWDGRDDRGMMTGSGVYMYILTSGDIHIVRKMIKLQ